MTARFACNRVVDYFVATLCEPGVNWGPLKEKKRFGINFGNFKAETLG